MGFELQKANIPTDIDELVWIHVKSLWDQATTRLVFPKDLTQQQAFDDVFKPVMGARMKHCAESTFKITRM